MAIDTAAAVDTLLQTAAHLADEVRRLERENRELRGKVNRKKLTATEVNHIRNFHRSTSLNQREIAEMFDVNPATVSRIVRGIYWKKG